MRHLLTFPLRALVPALVVALAAATPAPAAAECYVAYKAKKSPPLELHFGILSLSGGCPSAQGASAETAARIAAGGWTLLNIVSLSPSAPSATEQSNAGPYYLRY